MTVIQDQAEALRAMMLEAQQDDPAELFAEERAETARSAARVIAVTSGKGGVGKSNVAVNLAISFVRAGKRVLLLDADLGTANVDVLCNLPPGIGTIAHMVEGRRTLEEAIIDAPGGFRLIPGASGLANIAALDEPRRKRLVEQMHLLETDADIILIDTGAGVSPNVLSFLVSADQQLVVTTPEPTAMADAYAVIKSVHRQTDERDIRLLVNMVRNRGEAMKVFERIDNVSRRFLREHIWYAGYMATDVLVGRSVRARVPFALEYPRCEAARCLATVAKRLLNDVSAPPRGGLLRRMWGWLGG